MRRLDADLAARMARQAVDNVGREYPSAPALVLRSVDDLLPPRAVHPAFFGSYDWHSSVHQHWLLVRLLGRGLLHGADAEAARSALDATLTRANLEIEAAYLRERPSFERTYGWAWLLALASECAARATTEPRAAAWRDALRPAAEAVRTNWLDFLEHTTYPIRAGTHANSAFGLALGIDHARSMEDAVLAAAFEARALGWFEEDRDYPARLEPAGDDFLSPALMEAVLMSRLLGAEFPRWLNDFLPRLRDGEPATLFTPALVADRADGKTVHLDGLNLSRAWCWRTIAASVSDPRLRAIAGDAAERHLDAAMPHLFGGEYVAEHWVATFALLALTEPGSAEPGSAEPASAEPASAERAHGGPHP